MHVTMQMRSNANAIYQCLEKFDREKKKKVKVYSKIRNRFITSHPNVIRAQALGHHRWSLDNTLHLATRFKVKQC